MFTLLFILLPIAGYLTLTASTVAFGSFMKNREVPSPQAIGSGRNAGYELKLTEHQKAIVDFWECIQWFSILWPLETFAAGIFGVYKAVSSTVSFFVDKVKARNKVVQDRRILVKIEEEHAKVLENADISNGEMDLGDQNRLDSLERLLGQYRTAEIGPKALTSA